MASRSLDVWIAGKHAGELSQDESGALSFAYLRDYRGAPLSSTMPLSTRTYRDKVLRPYLWGLLPEDQATREHVAAEAGISPSNPFALLGVIGLDCPGAVQFCAPDTRAYREERLVPISDCEIAQRLRAGRREGFSWIAESEHWSLGGQQNKFALRKRGDEWFSCEGAAATTHIFKSGVAGLSHQALNEYVCMRLADACGIDSANVEYHEFNDGEGIEPAIVVERYDRIDNGEAVSRLHQEDFCQALGCLPQNKYTMYGGPSCADCIRLLKSTGIAARENVARFLQMLFFNYLIAATDAHAKNYSMILEQSGAHRLAPMYDVASIAPYVKAVEWKSKPPKLAMSIGGENKAGCVSARNIERMVEHCDLDELGITSDGCIALLNLYADMIPGKLGAIFDELEKTSSARAAAELKAHMLDPISQLCEKAKARLQ